MFRLTPLICEEYKSVTQRKLSARLRPSSAIPTGAKRSGGTSLFSVRMEPSPKGSVSCPRLIPQRINKLPNLVALALHFLCRLLRELLVDPQLLF